MAWPLFLFFSSCTLIFFLSSLSARIFWSDLSSGQIKSERRGIPLSRQVVKFSSSVIIEMDPPLSLRMPARGKDSIKWKPISMLWQKRTRFALIPMRSSIAGFALPSKIEKVACGNLALPCFTGSISVRHAIKFIWPLFFDYNTIAFYVLQSIWDSHWVALVPILVLGTKFLLIFRLIETYLMDT